MITQLFSQELSTIFIPTAERTSLREKNVCITGENGGKIRQLVPKTAAAVGVGVGVGVGWLGVGS